MKRMKTKTGLLALFASLIFFITSTSYLVAQDSLNMTKVFQWKDTTLPGSIYYNNTYNECWGYAKNGNEYAIIGSTMGTHFFNITNPATAYQVDFIEGATTGALIVHRDFHDYAGYLYMVVDEGPGTLQIADLSFLPDSVHLVYDSGFLFNRVHNIFIDTATARLYACSVSRDSGFFNAMEVYSLANPLNPVLIATWNVPGHVHDAFVRNDTAYLNCGNDGLYIVDFSNISQPAIIGDLLFYPDQGYNHSGWLTDDGNTYMFLDETYGMGLKICDASLINSISVKSLFYSGRDSSSMAHNVIIRGHIAYLSYYHDGVYMVDISDQNQPKLLGYYDTYLPSDHQSYRGAWGVYPLLPSGRIIASDMQQGLFVFEYLFPSGISKEETSKNQITLYPNPAGNQLNVKLHSAEDSPTEFRITNMLGQIQCSILYDLKKGTNHIVLDLSKALPEGIYILYGGRHFEPVTFFKHKNPY